MSFRTRYEEKSYTIGSSIAQDFSLSLEMTAEIDICYLFFSQLRAFKAKLFKAMLYFGAAHE